MKTRRWRWVRTCSSSLLGGGGFQPFPGVKVKGVPSPLQLDPISRYTHRMLRIEHISQPAVLVHDIDEAMDWLHGVFGIFPSERVDIARSGVNNAVYAFGNRTYLELIEPYDPESSAYRLLKQNGPGWHMVNVDIADDDFEVLDAEIRATGARVVQRNRTEHVAAAWHLHPRDTHGVLLNLANPVDHDEHGMWAGWAWREYVLTNTRVVDRILGLSLATDDLETVVNTWSSFGLRFSAPEDALNDRVVTAHCEAGTFVQIRSPRCDGSSQSDDSPAAQSLSHWGQGLCHLCWGVRDLARARSALEAAGMIIERSGESEFWTSIDNAPIAVPMEFRQI
ncbi:MAG: hypothetical protein CBB94_03030 [Gammaproteobacteria bacterium TMED34]|nr:MAG: hypothetical protein CBB94_03030 [Gammaproteobacteria bacterium TMED34]